MTAGDYSVPVQACRGAVGAHGECAAGVRGSFRRVAERDSGVEGGGDETRAGEPGVHPQLSVGQRTVGPHSYRRMS